MCEYFRGGHQTGGRFSFYLGLAICFGFFQLQSFSNEFYCSTLAVSKDYPLTNPLLPSTAPAVPFQSKFELRAGETVVLLGGTNMVERQQYCYLNTFLTMQYADQKIRFRNMAWEGDTVFEQYRPRAFYQPVSRFGEKDNRQKFHADVILVQFGKMESLAGKNGLAAFEKSYDEVLKRLKAYSQRIVLLSPTPFESSVEHNQRLALYSEATKRLAEQHHCLWVDLFGSLRVVEKTHPRLTGNGVNLNRYGFWLTAQMIASQLKVATEKIDITSGKLTSTKHEKIRQAILVKEKLWFQYWRPTNWAFLYGDRQRVPSSKRYNKPGERWFPNEVESVLPLLKKAEQRIDQLVGGGKK